MAAAAVVVSHNFGVKLGALTADPIYGLTGFTLGQHAVHVFFVLSGLLVSSSLARSSDLWDFAIARGLRIFPALLACVVATTLVLGPVFTSLSSRDYLANPAVLRHAAQSLTLLLPRAELPGLFAGNPLGTEVNLSLWTLKYEVACYTFLGILSVTKLLNGRRGAMCLSLVTVAIFISYANPEWIKADTSLDNARRFLLCFTLGALAFHIRSNLLLLPIVPIPLLAVCWALQIAATPLIVLLTAYSTLVAASFRIPVASRWCDHNDLSYGLYLYGWPVAQAVLAAFPLLYMWHLNALTFGIALPIAAMSWVLLERPALALRGRSLTSSSTPTIAAKA